MVNDHGGGGGRATDGSLAPLERHPATVTELDSVAGLLEGLAGQGVDLRATTDGRLQPATANWDGLASAELRQAPEPLRRDVAQSSDAMAWLAGSLRYWRSQVDGFNTKVGELEGERAEKVANRYGLPSGTEWDYEYTLARAEHDRQLRERWWSAHQTYIDEGSRTAASMLRDGPTAENLRLLAEAGVWGSPSGAVALLLPRWEDQAMQSLADEMVDLVDRVNDPYHQPTEEELARLEEVLGEYADNEAFAYYLLDGIGAEGLLTLTGKVATLQADFIGDDNLYDPALAETMGAIQSGLGVALATATTRRGVESDYPPGHHYQPGPYELDSEWKSDLLVAGRSVIPIGDPQSPMRYAEVYGYQLIGVLMHSGDYDEHFLGLVGGDMIDFERASDDGSSMWINQGAGENLRLDWITSDGTEDLAPAGYDPMNGLMSALERNPDGALAVFTNTKTFGGVPDYAQEPPDGYRLPRLDYLLTDREWREDVVGGPGYTTALWDDEDYVSPALTRFGTVLEAAAGLDDERAVDLVESIVYELNVDEQAMGYRNGDEVGDGQSQASIDHDLMHPVLREPIGNIMADYIWDVNRAVDATGSAMPGGQGAQFHDTHVVRLLADLGKDEQSHATLREAEAVYVAAAYDYYLSGEAGLDPDGLEQRITAAEQSARRYGAVMGALDYGAIHEDWYDQLESDNADNRDVDNRFMVAGFVVDQVADRTVGQVPVVGGLASDFIGGILDEARQAAQVDNSGLVTYGVSETLADGEHASADLAMAALYRSGQLPSLPEPLLVDGAPKPIEQWTDTDYQAWQGYKDTTGQATVVDMGNDAAGHYRDGVRDANEMLNGDVFTN